MTKKEVEDFKAYYNKYLKIHKVYLELANDLNGDYKLTQQDYDNMNNNFEIVKLLQGMAKDFEIDLD